MISIYSTLSTYKYKTHYTNLVLLIRNYNKIISKHFLVIHMYLSFRDNNISISTVEMAILAYLLHTKGHRANSILFGVQYFQFIITNVKIADLFKYAIINSSSIFGSIFDISENTVPISTQISLISLLCNLCNSNQQLKQFF